MELQQSTCRSAIASTWPSELQQGAIEVLVHENRSENPSAIGKPNKDGSRDYGCFQINNRWHKQLFNNSDWSNPIDNSTYAYEIYKGREQKTGNGWQAWYAVEGILW